MHCTHHKKEEPDLFRMVMELSLGGKQSLTCFHENASGEIRGMQEWYQSCEKSMYSVILGQN